MKDLHILWLWPSVLNLHGDRGNVMALKRWARAMGVKTKLTRVEHLADDFSFDGVNFVLLPPGQLKEMPRVAAALERKRGALEDYLAGGGALLAVGTTGTVLARTTTRLDGSAFSGLGLLPMRCEERTRVYGNDLIFDAGAAHPLAASQIQIVDTHLDHPEKDAFGKIIYGRGNAGGEDEGCRAGSVIFSNALGPLLVKNPWLTTKLIAQATGAAVPDGLDMTLEEKSLAAVTAYNKNKHQEA